MRVFAALVLLLVAMNSHANPDLFVSFLSAEVGSTTDLGVVEVNGVGAVRLIASKKDSQLIVHAQDPNGEVIGKAESIVGLNDTPIYVTTSAGLQKIMIYWGKN